MFVILNDACSEKQHALLSFSSVKGDKSDDLTCVFDPNEVGHPFIKVRSFIFYRTPMVRKSEHIAECVAKKTFIRREQIAHEVVETIINGVFESKFTPNYFKTYINGIPPF